jgi:hypothetical protein
MVFRVVLYGATRIIFDGFVKRPISALRGMSNRCGVHISTHAFQLPLARYNSKYRKP